MRLDRIQRQDEIRGDLFIGAIVSERPQDLNLARAERHYQSRTILPVIKGPPMINGPMINDRAALLWYRFQEG
jgi:hypothetical protein